MKIQSFKAFAAIIVAGSLLTGCGFIRDTTSDAWHGTKNIFSRDSDPEENVAPIMDDVPLVEEGEEILDFNLSPEGAKDYLGQYARDAQNKAFAAAPAGAFGVAFGYQNIEDAKNAALAKCSQDLRPGDLECSIYDTNGNIVMLLPARLKRVP